jgi:hypothetical protein
MECWLPPATDMIGPWIADVSTRDGKKCNISS